MALLLVALLLVSGGAGAQTPAGPTPQGEVRLFGFEERKPSRESRRAEVVAETGARVQFEVLSREAAERFRSAGPGVVTSLMVNPFPGLEIPVVLDQVKVWPDGGVTWSGHTEGERPGPFSYSQMADHIEGHVQGPGGERFQFSGTVDEVRIEQVATPPRECRPLAAPEDAKQHAAERVPPTTANPVINVLVVYTPQARTALGGTTAIQNAVRDAVAYLDQALVNTGVTTRVNLVGQREIAFPEDGTTLTPLVDVVDSTAAPYAAIRAARDELAADVVSLWISDTNDSTAGQAWLIGRNIYQDDLGYSVIRVSDGPAFRAEAFAHEIGHNLGCGHALSDPGSGGIYAYSNGYKDTSVAPFFRDIMAYYCAGVNCPTYQAFSNPDLRVSGRPFGRPAGGSQPADNRLTIANSGPVVAQFRAAVSDQIAPFGHMDTPKAPNNVNLSGQIGVTGWALDNQGVKKVEIWRSPAGADTPMTYIGDALFVEGARTDIPQQYPTYPNKTRAGWGYALLTYGLPNRGGNISLRLHAIAEDEAGNRTRLGWSDASFNNNARTQPFGTIDNPAPGEVISGSQTYEVRGWVLGTPGRSVTDASKVKLLVNGQVVASAVPTLGLARPDVASNFPGYLNASNPGFRVNMSAVGLKNGPNQVAMVATDSAGATDGFGSRFFTIVGGAAMPAPVKEEVPRAAASVPVFERGYRTGFDLDAPLRALPHDAIDVGPLSRLEVHAGFALARVTLDHQEQDLPGSSLDPARGAFFWMPPAAFFGEHILHLCGINGDIVTVKIRFQ